MFAVCITFFYLTERRSASFYRHGPLLQKFSIVCNHPNPVYSTNFFFIRSPSRFSPPRRRSRSPRRGIVGPRRMSPIRPFRSRRSPSPRIRDRSPLRQNRSPVRKKTVSKRSRSRSQSPTSSKHKKKHKRSRSK